MAAGHSGMVEVSQMMQFFGWTSDSHRFILDLPHA